MAVSLRVGNLMLARRHSEAAKIAVRFAVGASRMRLIVSWTEGILVSMAGGLAGITLACWITHRMSSLQVSSRLPGASRARDAPSHRQTLPGYPHLTVCRLLQSYLDDRLLNSFLNPILQNRFRPAGLLKSNLAALVVEFLESIEAGPRVAHQKMPDQVVTRTVQYAFLPRQLP
jgi:hypothetical protein